MPWSSSSPLTPLVTPGSPHFLMALFYPVIKARDQAERPREQKIIGMNIRTYGSRGTVRPLARKLLVLLFTATSCRKQDPKLQLVVSGCPVWGDLCRQKALVSVNTASVNTKIYWLAEEEQKISFILLWQICLALESALQVINSTDGRPKENPGASLKHTAWSIFFNHQ